MPNLRRFIVKLLTLTIYVPIVLSGIQSDVYAADPSFSLTPIQGFVKPGNEFINDILIDTEGQEVTSARAVLTFDPTMIQVVKAERNESLFCTWPENGQSIDNVNGVLMITGFCQTGAGSLYKTASDPDVFARVTYKSLKAGIFKIDWEYSGEDQPFKTVLMANGSPPQNIMKAKPTAANLTATLDAGKAPATPATPPPSNPGGTVPDTAASFNNKTAFIGGGFILLPFLLWILVKLKSRLWGIMFEDNKRTVVEYE